MSAAAAAWARAEQGATLDQREAEAAAAAAHAAGEGLRGDVAALPFGAEAPGYRTALLALKHAGAGHAGR